MTTQQIGGLPAPLPSTSVSDPQPSIGALYSLSQEVVINILSYLPHPDASVSLVSREMKRLGEKAVEQKLADKGVSGPILTQKWGIPVDSKCVSLMLRFKIDVPALALSPKKEALAELSMILDKHLDLLNRPNDLGEFLEARLLYFSLMMAQYFYGRKIFGDPLKTREAWDISPKNFLLFWEGIKSNLRNSRPSKADGCSTTPPCRTKEVREIVEYLNDNPDCPQSGLEVSGVEVEQFPKGFALPVELLSLPPLEICDELGPLLRDIQLGPVFRDITIHHDSMIPWCGVRTMTHIHQLRFVDSSLTSLHQPLGTMTGVNYINIQDSSVTSLPQELGQLKLRELFVRGCGNLTSLPESLCDIPTLRRVFILDCPQIRRDDPIIQRLVKNRVYITWHIVGPQ